MKSLTILASVLSALLVSATCGPDPEDPKPHVRPVPGAELCDEACARMAAVGPDGGACEEGGPVAMPDGGSISCTEFCVYQHDNGVYWNTECLVAISECSEIEAVCNQAAP